MSEVPDGDAAPPGALAVPDSPRRMSLPPVYLSELVFLPREERHYPFPEEEAGASARPVSPFRLPLDIELALWVPVRPFPRPAGTVPGSVPGP
jgi:hypothetical protein